jgi:hypothetical protein
VATITSAQSGDFSDPATWVGGVVPGVGDVAVAATGHVIVIDVDVTVDEVDQAGTGKFTLGNGRTLTANVTAREGTFTSGGTVEVVVTSGNTATIVGNVTGVSTTAAQIAGVVVSGDGRLEFTGDLTGSAGNVSAANANAAMHISSAADVDIVGNLLGGAGSFKFALNNNAASNITVTGNINGGSGASSLGFNNLSATTITITGNVTGGAANSAIGAHGINNSAAGAAITITGNLAGGGDNGAHALNNTAAATINITGNLNAGFGSFALNNTGAATINIVGNLFGANVRALENFGAAVINITGNISGGSNVNIGQGFRNLGAATITITGNITGASALGLQNSGASTITVTGTVTGAAAAGLSNTNASAVIEIDGTLQASATQPAVLSENTASITVSGPLITSSTAQTTASASGLFPIISRRWYVKESAIETFFIEMRSSDIVGEIRPSRTLYVVEGATADSGKLPAASDVRAGVVYGFNDAGTGTCAVPPPTAVASGVPVDATTGEAVLRQADAAAIFGAIWEQG